MEEIALRLKGKPALKTLTIEDQEQIKKSIEDKFLTIKPVIRLFKESFIEGTHSVSAAFNFYIPASEFFNEDGEFADKNKLTEMIELLKDAVLNIIDIDEDMLSSILTIKRPSNNGEYEIFVRLKKVIIGDSDGRNKSGRLQENPQRKYPASRKRFETEW